MPQEIKKAAGSAARNKGSNASKTPDSLQQHHPLQAVSGAVDAVYELPKKGAVPPAPSSTHHPLFQEVDDEGTASGIQDEFIGKVIPQVLSFFTLFSQEHSAAQINCKHWSQSTVQLLS